MAFNSVSKLQGSKRPAIRTTNLSPRMLVNSLYCCRLMYVTTAAYIVTYMHLVLLTAHLAYLAARYVVDGHSVIFFGHMITSLAQAILLGILYRGIKEANFILLRVAMSGLVLKTFLASAYLVLLMSVQWRPIEMLSHLNEFPVLRIFVSSLYFGFLLFSLITVHRCYKYYAAIRTIIRHKVDGSRKQYECCTNNTHYANRYASFARSQRNDAMSCIKFESEKNGRHNI